MNDKRQGRLLRIMELLERHGKVETAALSAELTVTELTIRRDIDHLDAEGVVRRVYGGAVLNSGRSFEPPFAMRLGANVEGKQAIASAVVDLIPRGANIALDFGTKAYYIALELRRRRIPVLAAPTSVQVIEVLGQDPDIRVIVPGGDLKPAELSFHGSTTEQFFRAHRWDVAVVGVAGITADGTVMSDYNESDARLKASIIASADRVVVLAESRHLGQQSFAPVGSLDGVTTVVTDHAGEHDTLTSLEARGVEVIRARGAEG